MGRMTLPPPPAFMAPVGLPRIEPGDDARLALARHRAAAAQANARLSASRRWYESLARDR